jgi:hypothetical protein
MLHFRGRNNRDATIRSLLSGGMKQAAEVVIFGCSAGGMNSRVRVLFQLCYTVNALPCVLEFSLTVCLLC